MDRKIFRNFYENREELKKFKELLADSLPQSVTVIDCESNRCLFANKTFTETFEPFCPATIIPLGPESLSAKTLQTDLIEKQKPRIDYLQVDQTSIREMGEVLPALSGLSGSHESLYLHQVLEKLGKDHLISDKTISLTTSYRYQEQRKLYEVILKKFKWDCADGIAVILNDITYQEKVIALKMANINKDKILATVSHELRTPLNGIIGLVDMVDKRVSDYKTKEYLSFCRNNAHLLLSLINSILDLQQIDRGKLKLHPNKVDIWKVFDDIITLFLFQCKHKGILLEARVAKEVPALITTDEKRLKQILINLVTNAYKFTSKGRIIIEATLDPENEKCVQISVTDTGIGIKKENLEKLFKMDGNLQNDRGVTKHGVGLGLTISNFLAIKLDEKGRERGLQVRSEEDKGSQFYFSILADLTERGRKQNEVKRVDKTGDSSIKLIIQNPTYSKQAPLSTTGRYKEEKDEAESKSETDENSVLYDELRAPLEIERKLSSYLSSTSLNFQSRTTQFINSPLHERVSLKKGLNRLETKQFIEQFHITEKDEEKHSETPISGQKYPTSPFETTQEGYLLVVDDNPFNLLVAENLIKDIGFSAKTAIGGKEAIEIVRTCRKERVYIKAILMDCQMPIMDGFETTRILRDMMVKNEVPMIPILAWTANNSEEDIKRCYECGMEDHLSKPASKEDLLKAIAKLR